MRPQVRLLTSIVFLFVCCTGALGQGTPACSQAQNEASSKIDRPKIDKIDPPGWWAHFPSPMLLVHGEGLRDAKFSVHGSAVTIERSQTSENGHWAFLWLDTQNASPQKLTITASCKAGEAHFSYQLAQRNSDPSAHTGFSSADVLYLIMTDRFADSDVAADPPGDDRKAPRGWHGGDFAGIDGHIDYLKQLGVTAVWTTPVASNGNMPESYHGYAATDLYAVDPHFGTVADYRRLSDDLHAHGIKLVIDLAPNHIGVEHPWVQDPPSPEWFHGALKNHLATQHDFYQLVDPHASAAASSAITNGWFTDAMPDLNQENPLVAQYLIQNALWWIETANLDGIRLDTFPYVGRAFWHDFHAELHRVYPHLTTVGEIFHRDPQVTSFFAGDAKHNGIDTGLDTPFDFPVYFAIRDVLIAGKPISDLANLLRQDELYPHPERLVTFIGNHDTTRFITEAGGSVPKLKLALGLILTLRGMPLIYSGDEIGMSGGKDPDDRRDFPGGFPGDLRDDSHNAFTQNGRSTIEQDIFRWTSGLLAYREQHQELQTGIEQNLLATDDVFVFVRGADATGCDALNASERLLVVINKSSQNKSIDLPVNGTALAGCEKYEGSQAAPGAAPHLIDGKLHIEETAESMSIYAVR